MSAAADPAPAAKAKYIIGIDEAGRGPLFGRVYAAAVILPLDFCSPHPLIKDSKKFHSKKKIGLAAEFVRSTAVAWAVAYEEPAVIDDINILRATIRTMHAAIRQLIAKLPAHITPADLELRIDGNYFTPFVYVGADEKIHEIPHETLIAGDDLCPAISAASILAKTERDSHILYLCSQDETLNERYNLSKNMGYGTKQHMEGIHKWGITNMHRRSFLKKLV
jgi:ribonuclease HII